VYFVAISFRDIFRDTGPEDVIPSAEMTLEGHSRSSLAMGVKYSVWYV